MLNLNVSARTLLCSNLILSSLLLSSVVLGQVDVIDSQPGSTQATKVVTNTSGELFYQLQLLQDEMMQLRGAIEEQQHQIQQLKQQRLDDLVARHERTFSIRLQTKTDYFSNLEGRLKLQDPRQRLASHGERLGRMHRDLISFWLHGMELKRKSLGSRRSL